jgi:hypothetical protein
VEKQLFDVRRVPKSAVRISALRDLLSVDKDVGEAGSYLDAFHSNSIVTIVNKDVFSGDNRPVDVCVLTKGVFEALHFGLAGLRSEIEETEIVRNKELFKVIRESKRHEEEGKEPIPYSSLRKELGLE